MQRESEGNTGHGVERKKANYHGNVTADVWDKSPYKIKLISSFRGTFFKSKIIGIRNNITVRQMVLQL